MATYADGAVIISIDADGKLAIKELENTKKEVGGLGDESEKTDAQMVALSASAAAAAAALIAVGAAAVNVSSQFDSAFAKTQTIMDTAVLSVSDMRDEILDLSQDSAMAATDVSEAVYQAISGSVATQDAAAFVSQANQLAVAGFTSLSNATDVLTTSLNAYGLEASAVGGISNVLIQTQNLGKTSVDELSASMGRAISTGSAYGVNLQNLATAYVELTRGGIATAEATTYLSGMLNELGDAGSTVGGIIQEQTGRSFGQLMADGWSLGDVLQVLSDSVNGNAEALMGLWSSQEAGKASNAIMTQGIADFNEVVAQMDDEMSGATGTTEKAYQAMTNTSEFIDQKLSNSVTNLGIAFGDDLRPAVDGVKKLLTGIIDWGTEFIQQNPWVAAGFAGLTAGAGALAIGLSLYTIKAKIATSATLKLTAAMATNPIMLAVAAVATLTVGIYSLATGAEDASASVEEMTAASRNLETVISESEAAYTATRDEIEGNAALARQYADRLQELESQQSMTAAEMEEYRATAEKLSTVLPDMNVEIDEQTGLLKDGADALRTQIDNWYELAVAQALQDKYKEQIQAQAEAEAELNGNLAKRQRLESDIAVAKDKQREAAVAARAKELEYQNLSAKYEDEESNRIAGIKTMTDAEFEALHAGYIAAQADYDRLSQEADGYEQEAAELEAELSATNKAISENQAAIEENAAQVEEAKNAYDYYADSVSNASQITSASAKAAQDWQEAAEALKTAYDEAYAAARTSIDGQIGLFQEMDEVVAVSAASLIESLDSQIAYMDEYARNMQLASERGVDAAILQQLNDGSAESAKILAGLASATDDQIAEINQKWTQVGQGKDEFAGAMAEYSGVVEDEKDVMVDLAAQVGIDMSDALTQGLLDGIDDYEAAWRQYQVRQSVYHVGVSAYAVGTSYASSGLALVGENGPELVYFRGGERVLTAEETQEALRSVYPTAPQMAYTGSGAPAIARGGGVQLRAVIAVPLEIDGREFARATAEYNGEEMEWGVM